ncbi:hypothetical protein K2Y11_05365 [bacterium]|nr:hypothetical protein [bacterium]
MSSPTRSIILINAIQLTTFIFGALALFSTWLSGRETPHLNGIECSLVAAPYAYSSIFDGQQFADSVGTWLIYSLGVFLPIVTIWVLVIFVFFRFAIGRFHSLYPVSTEVRLAIALGSAAISVIALQPSEINFGWGYFAALGFWTVLAII